MSKTDPTRVLLVANYGAEVAEIGGVLATNVDAGGESHAAVLLCRDASRPQVIEAGQALGTTVEFLDWKYGAVDVNRETKHSIVKVIRAFRPHILVTQDPEHTYHDLDPDRRMAVLATIEGIALAGREIEGYETPGLDPWRVSTIYYMWPERPNCVVDISAAWSRKCEALGKLTFQMTYSVKALEKMMGAQLENMVAGYPDLPSDYDKGLSLHIGMERANAMRYGLAGHGRFTLTEPFRRDGLFQLERLVP
jgi:LmbE family N-acetylglucosaminyl deacetylase